MNEKLLQYIWNFHLLSRFDFQDTENNSLEIIDFGKWNHDSGPDFSMAKMKTKNLVLVGNIEIHLKSSDWIFHQHSKNSGYSNVILHVVYLHDCEIEELQKRNIPTLELKDYVIPELFSKYEQLMNENTFIPCGKLLSAEKIPVNFAETSLLQKLIEKSLEIEIQLSHHKNDYEVVLFHQLAYVFGLKVNADIFRNIAESIDFSVIRKIRNNKVQLKALFYGKAGWLSEETSDSQMKIWKKEYDFLVHKYQISDVVFSPKFLRLRPANFPTLRLSQFADVLHAHPSLFSEIIGAENIHEMRQIFHDTQADEYWNNRFSFGKTSESVYPKVLTDSFIDLILINAVLPVKFAYLKKNSEEVADETIDFYREIPPEKNSVTERWKSLGVALPSALETQAFLYHYKNFCLPKKCLNCSIGLQILK